MLNIHRALENDRLLRALTGLNRKAFDELCVVFGAVSQEVLQSDSKPRKRARGWRLLDVKYFCRSVTTIFPV